MTSNSNASYAYDYNGNATSKSALGNTTNCSWDYENRLTQVTLPNNGGTVTFKYGPFGKRIYKQSPNATSIFVYDGDNLVQTVNSTGGLVAHYAETMNIDEPLAMQRSGTTYYFEADGLGSVTSVSSSAGALANTYTYDSIGNVTNSTGSVTNFLEYTGREFDVEMGLYYYHTRYYDPQSGRFLSEVPSRFRAGPNFYAYVFNSVSSLRDPFGLFPTWWHKEITTELARAVFGGKCASQAKAVGDADASVDDFKYGIGWGWIGSGIGFLQFVTHTGQGWAQPGPHFPNQSMLDNLHNKALSTCNLQDLGKSLHSRQDAVAHQGWSSFDHYTHGSEPDNIAAGSDLAYGAMLDTVSELQQFKNTCLKCCQ